MGDYIKVYTQNKTYLTYMPLKRMEELLPEDRFKRIHKSYIVAIDKIEKLEGNIIKISNSVIPIGQTFKKALFQIIEKSM
jgi:two-component system LytT family response regulator